MRHVRQESGKKRGRSEQSKVGRSANEAGEESKVEGGCGGEMGAMRKEGVRERLGWSKQGRQKTQSGERDKTSLLICSPYFQGTSRETFSLNI